VVKTDVTGIVKALRQEEREFLFEMVEPELAESATTLDGHSGEELLCVDDIEAYSNIMGRQKRRIDFLQQLYNCLERSFND
jgi:hypothetical protein